MTAYVHISRDATPVVGERRLAELLREAHGEIDPIAGYELRREIEAAFGLPEEQRTPIPPTLWQVRLGYGDYDAGHATFEAACHACDEYTLEAMLDDQPVPSGDILESLADDNGEPHTSLGYRVHDTDPAWLAERVRDARSEQREMAAEGAWYRGAR